MTRIICNFWHNFKNKPDIWFFYAFLLSFILSIRKVISYLPIQKTFNEYSGIYIYLSDIFLIVTLCFWIISILCNNIISLSRIKLWISSVFHKLYLLIPLFLVFLFFSSVFWSEYKTLAFFRSIKLLEFYILYLYIIFRIVPISLHIPTNTNCSTWNNYKQTDLTNEKSNLKNNSNNSLYAQDKNVPRGTFSNEWKNSDKTAIFKNVIVPRGTIALFSIFLSIIIFLGLSQAIIGLLQFFSQNFIGLFWLKESIISPDILGVAKIILNNKTLIRAYGLMPHPNILGGFLLFSIISTLLYYKLFHVEQWQGNKLNQIQIVPRGTIQYLIRKRNSLFSNLKKLRSWLIQQFRKLTIFNKLFHVEQFINFLSKKESSIQANCSTWNNLSEITPQNDLKNLSIKFNIPIKWLLKAILLLQCAGLVLSFSKSAIIGLFLALIYIYIYIPIQKHQIAQKHKIDKIVPRGTIANSNSKKTPFQNKSIFNYTTILFQIKSHLKIKLFHVEQFKNKSFHYKKEILIILIFLFSFFLFAKPDINAILLKPLNERISYLIVPRGTIQTDPILGIGAGQSVILMQKFYAKTLNHWEYQPIHNVFLIILSELGIIGFIFFTWWIFKLFHVEQFPKNKSYQKYSNCSTWNNQITQNSTSQSTPNKTIFKKEQEKNEMGDMTDKYILQHDSMILSNIIASYFKGILIGFIFIMLFDHYLWYIQQGQIMLFMTFGLIIGIHHSNDA